MTTGLRNASIDLAACAEQGITVCGTGSSFRPPAELTWALILGLARHVVQESVGLRRGDAWQQTVGTDLHGATLGLLGLGRIGTAVAAVGTAFGMRVTAWSPHLTDERATSAGARLVGKEELFATADFVSLHLVLADATRGIVGRDGAGGDAVVGVPRQHVARGPRRHRCADRGPRHRRDRGGGARRVRRGAAALGHRLRGHPRVLATPHLGYVTHANYTTFFTEAVEDIAAWLAGSPVR